MRMFKKVTGPVPLGLVLCFLMLGCQSDDMGDPVLVSVSPIAGPKQALVTIGGENFGKDPEKVEVYFNGASASVESVSMGAITARVPAGCLSGAIRVVVNGVELSGPEFQYVFSETRVETFVGSGDAGYENGEGDIAKFSGPAAMVGDSKGNLFVTDVLNHAVRKVDANGRVSTFAGGDAPEAEAGYADGPGTDARFEGPYGIVVDDNDNLYVVDTNNARIRMIAPSGEVSTIAGSGEHGGEDGVGQSAQFHYPNRMVMGNDNALYVTEGSTGRIRRVSMGDFKVTTYAGSEEGYQDGPLLTAKFNVPSDLAIDPDGGMLISDNQNAMIRKIEENSENVTTLVGSDVGHRDGDLASALLSGPRGIGVGADGTIFFADGVCIRQIDAAGNVTTIAGDPNSEGYRDGPGDVALFQGLFGLWLSDDNREIYVADTFNNVIRKIILVE
ncbi:IPT/TIG domain-containing protein [Flagellimonas algicola]|uniref:IPT/TIG domain-containing protein n=1 Tax=Flagellimonas algicola TaxID=2583815 RepID=A0ABY2WGF1_9FLAO|nr:IPT/TIG domain-containing protein [Allomuricauda algicola]TMU50364.1 hypothetical protein FGG15_20015 [Allomuricauda algicola]